MPATRLADLIVDSTNSSDATTNRAIIEVVGGGAAGLVGPVRLQDGTTSQLAAVNANGALSVVGGNPSVIPDNFGQQPFAGTIAYPELFNNLGYDRARDASAANLAAQSGLGTQLVTAPGQWTVPSVPGVNAVASATRTGSTGVRHILQVLTASIATGAVAPVAIQLNVYVRDGAAGAGAILYATALSIQAVAGASATLHLPGLHIVGSVGAAMTVEFSAAGGANTQETISFAGYDAS